MDYTHEQLATRRRKLAQEYNRDKKEIGEILQRKAFEIIKIKAEVKTWKEAEIIWQTSEDGQKWLLLDNKCKGLIELIRSMKSEIDIKQSEAYNQY